VSTLSVEIERPLVKRNYEAHWPIPAEVCRFSVAQKDGAYPELVVHLLELLTHVGAKRGVDGCRRGLAGQVGNSHLVMRRKRRNPMVSGVGLTGCPQVFPQVFPYPVAAKNHVFPGCGGEKP
jgi:hypothetical protein